ncbi:MAG: RNB domain-containing ribonuclease [Lachnospiraceae bacterium]|nr:RNB domain-containing ribonuclease [Lachnospiraceae bacterium]
MKFISKNKKIVRPGDKLMSKKAVKRAAEVKEGIFCGTTRGFGFVQIEGEEDIFVPERDTKGALHGDTVQVEISGGAEAGKRREGKIIKIVKHDAVFLVGTFEKSKNYGFVIPDNLKLGSDIYIAKEHTKGAVNGHKVYVKITDYGNEKRSPEGRVVEILGHINDPAADVKTVLKTYNLETEFPEEVMVQTETMPESIEEKETTGRLDLRGVLTVTIDGEDAKDLDDAITIKKLENGNYELGVHIADVTNYVKEGSPLDREALHRGTSVYLVDRVIPMLPHRLSNGICSLNAGVDRLALSCIMEIDENGTVIGHQIAETVIRVTRRMSYTEVNRILKVMRAETMTIDTEGDSKTAADGNTDSEKVTVEKLDAEAARAEIMQEYGELTEQFLLMKELSDILRDKRRQRGAVDFDFPESKITLAPNGRPIEIKPYERNDATKLIEDFMLAANETVAEDFFWQEAPFVYRTHENPDPDKIKKLGIFIKNFGLNIKEGKDGIHPKELQKLLDSLEGKDEAPLISRLTLRSLKQAKYSTDCEGHFGLAAKYYCHFTSPIRRYPDLQIHRIIKDNLNGRLTEEKKEHYLEILDDVALQSSKTERTAEEAEREVEKMKKVEYMERHIGEVYDGVISGVTNWGIYVELPNTVEGIIHLENVEDDFYRFDEEHYQLVGEHFHKVYRLGQHITIMVLSVDKLLKTVDFLPFKR